MATIIADPERKHFFHDRYVTTKLGQDREQMDRVMISLGKAIPATVTAKAGLKMP